MERTLFWNGIKTQIARRDRFLPATMFAPLNKHRRYPSATSLSFVYVTGVCIEMP